MKPRLLVFEFRMLGDAIMSLPFIRSASAAFQIHVTCTPKAAAVYRNHLPDEQIIPWTPGWLKDERSVESESDLRTGPFLKSIQALKPDIAVCAWADARTHYLLARSGAKRRIGFPMTAKNFFASHLGWRKRQIIAGAFLNVAGGLSLARPLLTEKLQRHDYRQHHVEDWRQLAEVVEVEWKPDLPWTKTDPAALSNGTREMLAGLKREGKRIWLVHPGARLPEHRWPQESFARVIREVFPPNEIQTLIIQPPDLELSDELKQLSPIVGTEDLPQLFALLAEVDGVLCNDTGVSHAAAAVGRRVVSVFTAGEPDWFAPWGSRDLAVRQDVCPHHPCLGRCVMPSVICRDAVTVEQVKEKVLQALNG